MSNVRVNVRTRVNNSAIRRETRNGRDVVIVPSATMPDNVIMNGVLYPAEEIASSFMSLNRTTAPFGHPIINGEYLSASDPEALNSHYVGAWNENVRQEGGRVLLDKVIDVQVANQSENGKRLMEAINNSDPIHTSTGLFALMTNVEGKDHKKVAKSIVFDHDAILLDEEGAATPDQGVGMMVNSSEKVQVINSVLEEEADRQMDWALEEVIRAADKKQRAPVLDKLKSVIMEAISLGREPTTNQGEDDMSAETDKQIKEMGEQIAAMNTSIAGLATSIGEAVTNGLKPLLDATNAQAEAAEKKAKEEHEVAVNKAAGLNIVTEDTAKTMPLAALNELIANHEGGKKKAAPIGGASFSTNSGESEFKAPKGD